MNFDFSENMVCALECCGEVGLKSSGFSYQTGPPHRVLWFCSQGCLVEQLMDWEYVTDGFSLEWGRHA